MSGLGSPWTWQNKVMLLKCGMTIELADEFNKTGGSKK